MSFALFVAVNAVLILRPTEIVPGLSTAPLYEIVILSALAASAGAISRHVELTRVGRRPVTACVFGVCVAVVLSLLARGQVAGAVASGTMYVKLVLYYLLVVATLRSGPTFRRFLRLMCLLLTVQVSMALLQYFELIEVEALKPYMEKVWSPHGEVIGVNARLCAAGIFNDPNDLCVLMAVGVVLSLALLTDRTAGVTRFAWAAPCGVFLAAVPLTHSRGGFLALLGGLGTLVLGRLGLRRGAVLVAAGLPVVLAVFGGRMTKIEVDNSNDTSQQRMRAWSDGLVEQRRAPVFGIGQGQYPDVAGMCAHNTYVESYTELGFVGGTCVTGAFAYVGWCLVRLCRAAAPTGDPGLDHLRPYLLAAVVALMTGMVSLSRGYSPPTYLILGLAAAYLQIVAPRAPRLVPPLSQKLVLCGLALSAVTLVTLHLGTALLVQR